MSLFSSTNTLGCTFKGLITCQPPLPKNSISDLVVAIKSGFRDIDLVFCFEQKKFGHVSALFPRNMENTDIELMMDTIKKLPTLFEGHKFEGWMVWIDAKSNKTGVIRVEDSIPTLLEAKDALKFNNALHAALIKKRESDKIVSEREKQLSKRKRPDTLTSEHIRLSDADKTNAKKSKIHSGCTDDSFVG